MYIYSEILKKRPTPIKAFGENLKKKSMSNHDSLF